MNKATKTDFSILIGRVSTEDSTRILEALDALRVQDGDCSYEVVVADRLQDEVTGIIRQDYPEVRLIDSAPEATLPAMRTQALGAAIGRWVIVTEDHCVPSQNWLQQFSIALNSAPDSVAAVGGCVENGVDDTALDWATFLCEYSGSVAPVPEGIADGVPGMNVAYRRRAFEGVDENILRKGFWETTLHPVLHDRNQQFFSSNEIVLNHCKKFSLGLFCRQRYVYSRYYAGIRFSRTDIVRRGAAAVMSLALPPLLLWRMRGNVTRKNRLQSEFRQAFPYLFLFTLIWAAGEIVGYLGGPGKALAEIE